MTKKHSLVGGIGLLGLAGLICKVVGVLYRIPLANMIGGEGLGLYQQVMPAYNLLLTITSAGIPVAISRLVSHHVTLERHRTARKIFRVSLKLLTVLGIVTTILLFALSRTIARAGGTPEGYSSYMCIAPSLLFVCVMSAFRGYMQGMRHMLPTAVSQLIEQVGKVAVALPMASIGFQRGGWVMGAAGALLGTSLAECVALLYMILHMRKVDTPAPVIDEDVPGGRRIASQVIAISIPITLGACIVPLASTIDSAMLKNLMTLGGLSDSEARIRYGMYSGMVITMINVPTALAMAMSTNLVPDIASGMARGDMPYVSKETCTGLRIASLVGFPCSIGMSLLAKPILFLCYGSSSYTYDQLMLAGDLLHVSAMTIILFTQVQATSGILQGVGKQRIPMLTLLMGVVLKITLNLILVRNPDIGIHGAPIASLVCYTVSMVPNLYFSCKYTRTRFRADEVILRPLAASAVMGVSVYAVYRFLFGGDAGLAMGQFGRTLLTVAVSMAVGVVSYAAAAYVFRAFRTDDLPIHLPKRKA